MTDYQYYLTCLRSLADQLNARELQYYAFMALKKLPKDETVPSDLLPYLVDMAAIALGEKDILSLQEFATKDFWRRFSHEVQKLHLIDGMALDNAFEVIRKKDKFTKKNGHPYTHGTCKRKYEVFKASVEWDSLITGFVARTNK